MSQRVDIGFKGGPSIAVKIEDAVYAGLRKALEDGAGWYTLATEDSDVTLDLREVNYVRLDTEQHRVGF